MCYYRKMEVMEEFRKELDILQKYLLHGEYPVGMTKADKANLRRKCRNNFKTEDGILYYQKMWRKVKYKRINCGEYVCIRTCKDKMLHILESCHAGLADNGMMKNTIPLSLCVCACVCVCVCVPCM